MVEELAANRADRVRLPHPWVEKQEAIDMDVTSGNLG
jgi:hypothetical protein